MYISESMRLWWEVMVNLEGFEAEALGGSSLLGIDAGSLHLCQDLFAHLAVPHHLQTWHFCLQLQRTLIPVLVLSCTFDVRTLGGF